MAAQQRLASAEQLQGAVRDALQSQLGLLHQKRESHSHSDLLLPPDMVSSILEVGSLQLKSLLNAYLGHFSEDPKEREEERKLLTGQTSVFAFEARKLVSEALKSSKGGQDLGRSETKEIFERMDVALNLEMHGEQGRRPTNIAWQFIRYILQSSSTALYLYRFLKKCWSALLYNLARCISPMSK